jgi:putative ABC transport system permease protein
MFKNNLKIAFRSLWKHRVYSGINLLGLAVGMSAGLLIFLYVSFERNFDCFNDKADRIYRVIMDTKTATEVQHAGAASPAVGPNLKVDFPQVEAQARISFAPYMVANGDLKFHESGIVYADSSIFRVFSFPLVEGDPGTALKAPFSAVLSQTAAKKYFGTQDPMGKSLTMDNQFPVKVTGVMKDIPGNAHFRTDIFLSMTTMSESLYLDMDKVWGNPSWFTYVLLSPGTDPGRLQTQFPNFLERHAGDMMRKNQVFYTLFLQPLKGIHLDPGPTNFGFGTPTGSKSEIYVFSIIAAFILLIAAINFVNLATARASERAMEVGIRKVVGALRGQLTLQFLGESILLCGIAYLLAIGLGKALMPLFDQMSGKPISLYIREHGGYYTWGLLGIALGIGVIAGLYPALLLSGFRPIAVLKGRFGSGKKGLALRQGLVVFQFAISIALIVGTIVVFNQLKFMRSQELGFKKDQMMIINFYGDSAVRSRAALIRLNLLSMSHIKSVSFSESAFGRRPDKWLAKIETPVGNMQSTNPYVYMVDVDFLHQYGVILVAGRSFSRDFPADSGKAIVINEAVARSLGYTSPAAAVGKRISMGGMNGNIIGVVKDFHYQSLVQPIQPLVFSLIPIQWAAVISLQLAGEHIPETVAALQREWKVLAPQLVFDYSFADAEFDHLYASEDRFGRLFLCFALLAVFISCLGLLGLAAYSTFQRTKEVGIRKVLGASVAKIVGLLSLDFLRLVCIALVIATPLAWWGMHRWLQDFAYRTGISGWVFVLAGGAAVGIAFLTVSFHAIKAALANPVKSLRAD